MISSESGVLAPNDLLLLAAAAPPDSDAQRAELVDWTRASGFSWQRALDLAASNRVPSVAAQQALAPPLAALFDEDVRRQWVALRDAAGARVEAATLQLREAAEAMARRGVVPLLYKGLDFHASCYPPGVARSFNDIDVIVRPHEAVAAAEALRAEGYALPPGTPSLDYFRRFHLHAIFLDRDRARLPIELHWALDSPHSGAPDVLPLVLDRAAPDPDFAGVLRPDPVDALALMAGHLDKHLGLSALLPSAETRLAAVIEEHGLMWLLDIVLWMRARGDRCDGAEVEQRMRELDALGSLTVALRLALDLDPAALPAWAVARAENLPGATPLVARAIYPDLCAGGPPTERARRLRAWAFRTLPEVGFAPISALGALLPSPRPPGVERPGLSQRLAGMPARLALLAANVLAVIRWRIDRWRSDRLSASERAARPDRLGD